MPSLRARVRIQALAAGGAGLGRLDDGSVAFVDGTAPGDLVEVCIERRRSMHCWARLLTVVDPSPLRVVPPCPFVEACGGCPWMHVDPGEQARAKEAIVYDALARLGGIDIAPSALRPIVAADRALRYRRRARLQIRGGSVGFVGRRSHRLVDVDRCAVLVPELTHMLEQLRGALETHGGVSGLRQVGLVAGTDRVAASFHFDNAPGSGAVARTRSLAAEMRAPFVALRGEVEIARAGDPTVRAGGVGSVHIYARPDLFAQAHQDQNEELSLQVASAFGPEDEVLELYCGNGNLTFPVAAVARQITSVEQSAVAVELAARTAREARVGNVRFIAGDALSTANALVREGRVYTTILLDPPRSGAQGIGRVAGMAKASRVVYVSCDPATLARDARELGTHGYRPTLVLPVDMFPQTAHVETLAVLVRA